MEEAYELTELELNSVAYHDGRRKGEREGELKGKLEGKLEGLIELVLTILELRQIPIDASAEARIRTSKDPEQLERWAAQAKRVDELAAVFDS